MSATQKTEIRKLHETVTALTAGDRGRLAELRKDPAGFLTVPADPWQRDVLRGDDPRLLMLASRQSGKSTVAAALALKMALLRPGSLTLICSPTLRQSGEMFRDKVCRLFEALGPTVAVRQRTQLQMELANGSRVVSLPGENDAGVRGFSGVALLILDEGSRVSDALYYSVRPMLAVSQGRLVCLSTPYGRRGWFHDAWTEGEGWRRVKVTARECPRISAEFLAAERRAIGDLWYRQEYDPLDFVETVESAFAWEDILAGARSDVKPLFSGAVS